MNMSYLDIKNAFLENNFYYSSKTGPNVNITGVLFTADDDEIVRVRKNLEVFEELVPSITNCDEYFIGSFAREFAGADDLKLGMFIQFAKKKSSNFSRLLYDAQIGMSDSTTNKDILMMLIDYLRKLAADAQKIVSKVEELPLISRSNMDLKIEYDISKIISLDQLFIINSIEMRYESGWTCPLKTFAVFAHDQDIHYEDEKLLDLFSEAKTLSNVSQILGCKDLVPPVFACTDAELSSQTKSKHIQQTLAEGVEYVEFDQFFYRKKRNESPLRLLAWIRLADPEKVSLHVLLKQTVATRFVTVKLIDIKNLMENYKDDHAHSNVDLQVIKFYGKVVPSLLAKV